MKALKPSKNVHPKLASASCCIHESNAPRPRPFFGAGDKPSPLTGSKLKISDVANLIALNKNTVFFGGIRTTHANNQPI